MRVIFLMAALFTLSGCFRITAVEHSVYGGMSRNYSGGEVYSSDPSGHQEQGGGWNVGSKIKTVWTR